MASDTDSLAAMLTKQLAATRRDLQGVQARAAQSLCPVWNQSAVSGACHRVFRNARSWSKKSRNKIAVISGRGGNDAQTVETHQSSHVRAKLADGALRVEDGEIIAGFGGCGGWDAQPLPQLCGCGTGGGRSGWKVERQEVVVAGDGKLAGTSLKPHYGVTVTKMPENDMGGSERRMTAQVHFKRGREPPEVKE